MGYFEFFVIVSTTAVNTCVCLGKCAHSHTVGIHAQCTYAGVAGVPVSYGRDSRSVSPSACTIRPASSHEVKPPLPGALTSTCYCASFYFSHPPGCKQYLALELTCISLLSGVRMLSNHWKWYCRNLLTNIQRCSEDTGEQKQLAKEARA